MKVTMVLFWIAMVVWVAAAVAPGAAAASVFTTVPHMGVSVDGLQEFFGSDTVAAGRYVAGRAIQPLFVVTDWIQMSAGALAVSTAIRWWRLGGFNGPRWMASVAVVLVLGSAALLAAHLVHTTGLRAELAEYWTAVGTQSREAAAAAKARFDHSHRVAERITSAQVALLLTAIAAAACTHSPRNPERGFAA